MKFQERIDHIPRPSLAAALMGVISFSTGILVLSGWAFDISYIKGPFPGGVSMKPNTALGFVVFGFVLIPISLSASVNLLRGARALALFPGLVGFLTLIQYAFKLDLGIDELIFREAPGTIGTSFPGRMAPDTAVSFLLLSLSLFLADYRFRIAPLISLISGLLVAAIGLASSLSYLTPSLGLVGWWGLTMMAPHAALLCGMLGAATILSSWQKSPLARGLHPLTTTAFGLALVLLVSVGLTTNRSLIKLAQVDRAIMRAEQIRGIITSMLAEVDHAENEARGFSITGEARFQKSQILSDSRSRKQLARLQALTRIHNEQPERINRIAGLVDRLLDWLPQIMAARYNGDPALALTRVSRGETLMEDLRLAISGTTDDLDHSIARLQKEAEAVLALTYRIVLIGTLASLGLFLGSLGAVYHSMVEQQRAESALIESEGKYRSLFEHMLHGFAYCRMIYANNAPVDFVYLEVNPAFEDLTGLDDVEGKKVSEVVPGIQETNPALFETYGRVASTGLPERFETYVPGLNIWFAIAVYSPEKEYFVAIFDNITERKQAEAEIQRLNEHLEDRVAARTSQLEAANKELEAFSYSVSHDLRAPLRGIDGWSLALLEDYGPQLDVKARGFINRVRSETQRMGQLIDDMLQFSRITRGEMIFEPVDLTAMALQIMERIQEEAPDRSVNVLIQEGMRTVGDPHLLGILLTNLLGNAFKFTGKTLEPRIEMTGAQVRGEQIFSVRDNGAGFDMAFARKLFGAFQRMHKTSEFPGTGIGLAVAQRIVNRHNGRIWAESQANQGTTFYFIIGGPL